jgi:hypothetical protein
MWVSRRHLTFLEAEITDWKQRYEDAIARNESLLRTMFSVQGAPEPFEDRQPARDQVIPGPEPWPSWRDQLEAAASRAIEENAEPDEQGH